MKKTLIAAAVMAASGVAFAASNVTLYGVIEEGVVLEKAKHGDTLVKLQSGFDQGSRWGIKGVEDLGNGYAVGFILEQGLNWRFWPLRFWPYRHLGLWCTVQQYSDWMGTWYRLWSKFLDKCDRHIFQQS